MLVAAACHSKQPDNANTHILYLLSIISSGKLLVSAATVAPKPSETKIMGSAQLPVFIQLNGSRIWMDYPYT